MTEKALKVTIDRGAHAQGVQTISDVPPFESQTVLDVVFSAQQCANPTLSNRFACRVDLAH